MKILFLDDEEWRHEKASKAFVGHDLWHVHNIDEFRRALVKAQDWDLICLDHDLGDPLGNGKFAAHMVAVSRIRCIVWIHSWNIAESLDMFQILTDNSPCKVYRGVFGDESIEALKEKLGI